MKKETCWIWPIKCSNRYGGMWICGQNVRAHRLSYFLHNSTINRELLVLHRCNNELCVNPDHLYQGTSGDNHVDMVRDNPKAFSGRPRRKDGSATI